MKHYNILATQQPSYPKILTSKFLQHPGIPLLTFQHFQHPSVFCIHHPSVQHPQHPISPAPNTWHASIMSTWGVSSTRNFSESPGNAPVASTTFCISNLGSSSLTKLVPFVSDMPAPLHKGICSNRPQKPSIALPFQSVRWHTGHQLNTISRNGWYFSTAQAYVRILWKC